MLWNFQTSPLDVRTTSSATLFILDAMLDSPPFDLHCINFQLRRDHGADSSSPVGSLYLSVLLFSPVRPHGARGRSSRIRRARTSIASDLLPSIQQCFLNRSSAREGSRRREGQKSKTATSPSLPSFLLESGFLQCHSGKLDEIGLASAQ